MSSFENMSLVIIMNYAKLLEHWMPDITHISEISFEILLIYLSQDTRIAATGLVTVF
ncbi:MAG: hypothetical protein ACJ718_10380 [Nitrososphaeraceae archaeon]